MASLPVRNGYYKESWSKTFNKARDASMMAIKFISVNIGLTAISLTAIFPLFRHFVNQESFALPALIHLPFLPPVNLPFYLINLVHQVYTICFGLIWSLATVCFIFTMSIQAWFHLEAIKSLVGNMREGIATEGYQNWLKQISIELVDVKR